MRVIPVLAVVLLAASVASAQTVSPAARRTPTEPVSVSAQSGQSEGVTPIQSRSSLRKTLPLPVDVPRIEREIAREPAIKVDDSRIRFYVLIVAKQPPTWEEIVGSYDLMNGPTRGGAAMTHKEFINMVTPQELNELFNATSRDSLALAQAAIMNAVGQSFIKKAVQALRGARSESEIRQIRKQIDRELSALEGRSP